MANERVSWVIAPLDAEYAGTAPEPKKLSMEAVFTMHPPEAARARWAARQQRIVPARFTSNTAVLFDATAVFGHSIQTSGNHPRIRTSRKAISNSAPDATGTTCDDNRSRAHIVHSKAIGSSMLAYQR